MAARIPFVDLRAAHAELGAELESAIARVVESGRYLLGPELEAFEAEFAAYCRTRHCVGVGSGLSALELTLAAAGIGPGDEVIVPAYTWVATWIAASRSGAKPVGVDVEADTYNIDPNLIEAAITDATAAIVPVHFRGQPADMDAIAEIAERHGLFVLEDAAQAHGAHHEGRRAGSIGAAGAFSFYPSKNLGALGDAGAVTTDDDGLADRIRLLRNNGMRGRYEIETAGVNSRMAEIQAAVLRVKLERLDKHNGYRTELANAYREALDGLAPVSFPEVPAWAEPVWHLLAIGHPDRDACRAALAERGIEALVHYPQLPHTSGAYRDAGFAPGAFPVAEQLCARTLSLPMYPQLEPAAPAEVADAVAASLDSSP